MDFQSSDPFLFVKKNMVFSPTQRDYPKGTWILWGGLVHRCWCIERCLASRVPRCQLCGGHAGDGAHLFAPPKTSHYMSLLYYHIVQVQGSCELPILFFGTACWRTIQPESLLERCDFAQYQLSTQCKPNVSTSLAYKFRRGGIDFQDERSTWCHHPRGSTVRGMSWNGGRKADPKRP